MRNLTKLGVLLAVVSACVTCSRGSGSGSESNFLCRTDADCPRGACIDGVCDPEAVPAATPLQLDDASVVEAGNNPGIIRDGSGALADALTRSPDASAQSDGAVSACWAAHGSACNPLTNEPCNGAAGEVCRLTETGLACEQVGMSSPWRGDGCSLAKGPLCGPGLHCTPDIPSNSEICRELCCADSDCSDVGSTCQPLSRVATLGTCTLPPGEFLGSACGVRDPVQCMPIGDRSRGCDSGTTCKPTASDAGWALACMPWFNLAAVGFPCDPSVNSCEVGTYCSPVTNVCRSMCCSDSGCAGGQTCHAFDPASLGSLGYCE